MISQADLSAMPRTTPTSLAEAISGSAGRAVGIPKPTDRYGPQRDPKRLGEIAWAARAAYRNSVLTPEWTAYVASELVADIDRRFPRSDMAVLAKYGPLHTAGRFARVVGKLRVSVAFREMDFAIPERVLPLGAECFTAREHNPANVARVPEAVRTFFVAAEEVDKLCPPKAMDPVPLWPGQFHNREKRWPSWAEIEAAFPIIGTWLAEQRAKS